ncbi:MAG: phasin family protein [Pseudomonadota bacterium]
MSNKSVELNENLMASFKAMNELAIANAEKLMAMNLEQIRKQSDVTVAAMRSAMELKDADDVKNYVTDQTNAAKDVLEGLVADAQAIGKMNEETSAEIARLMKESAESVR